MNLLEEFGLSHADIAFLYSENKKGIALCMRSYLNDSDKVTLEIFSVYFNRFLQEHGDECYEEVALKGQKWLVARMLEILKISQKRYLCNNLRNICNSMK